MAKPSQDGIRFFNHYHYNSYSQRSEEPDSTKNIVLGLGDSVIFGGMVLDNEDISTTLFGKMMSGWQMLNISAGSWGPDNCAAYLKHYGLFGAKAMMLVVGSHDAYDNMDFQKVVGVNSHYPDKQYCCGWVELIDRYVWPRVAAKLHMGESRKETDPDQKVLEGIGIHKNGQTFNPGFDQLKAMADSANIPLIVYLHPDIKELKDRKYNEQGVKIIAWAKKNNVKLVKEMDYHFTQADSRDGIHQSKSGQRKMAEIMVETIKSMNLIK